MGLETEGKLTWRSSCLSIEMRLRLTKSNHHLRKCSSLWRPWHAWFAKVGAGLVDGGDGLLPTGKIVKPTGVVTDGPFIEGKDIVGGYSIVQADTYDQAVEYAKSCPIMMVGGTIEVRELAGLG